MKGDEDTSFWYLTNEMAVLHLLLRYHIDDRRYLSRSLVSLRSETSPTADVTEWGRY